MKHAGLLALGWIACVAAGCSEDGSPIRDRTGEVLVVNHPWDPPSASAGRGAVRRSINATLIPLRDRVDMVHDGKRNLLYVSTDGGEVQRWDLQTQQILHAWRLGGSLVGMDISPNGDVLVVADKVTPRIHHVDLNSEAQRTFDLLGRDAIAGSSSGTFSVAFIDAARVMVSYAQTGSSELQVVDFDGSQSNVSHRVRSATLLVSDPSHSFIAFATQNDFEGTFGSYSVADESFRESQAGAPVFEIAVSRGGERYALATGNGLRLLDASLSGVSDIGMAGGRPLGTAFTMPSDRICVTWLEGGSARHRAIEVYDSASRQLITQLDDTRSLFFRRSTAFGSGHMRTSRDGSLLFVSVDEGILQLTLAP